MDILTRIKSRLGLKVRSSAEQNFNFVPLLNYSTTDVKNPMQESTWVMRAIKMITQPITAVPLEFCMGTEDREYTDEMLEAFWLQPAVGMSMPDLIEAFVGWMKIKGEFFVLMDDTWSVRFADAKTRWSQLIIARPDRMREIVRGGELVGWQYVDASGRSLSLLAEQVIHSKYWNPYNQWRGLAEYDAALLAVETDVINQRFAKNLASANGDTGPIISAKGHGLSDAQVKQIVAQLEAKRRAQLRGEFVPAFLNGEVSVEESSIRSPDAVFQLQRTADKEQIYTAFGIPASMATPQASYSIGSASDYYRMIETACMPMAARLAGIIGRLASHMSGKMLTAYFDWDEHSTVQQVRNERIASATALWDRGMAWESVNQYLSLGMKPFTGWNLGYVSFGLTPVGSAQTRPEDDAAFAELLDDDTTEGIEDETDASLADLTSAAKSALRARSFAAALADRHASHHSESDEECGCSDELAAMPAGLSVVERAAEASKRAAWASHMSKRKSITKAFHGKVSKLVMEARSELLKNLDAAEKKQGAAVHRAPGANWMWDLGKWRNRFVTEMKKVGLAGFKQAGNELLAEVGNPDAWEVPMPAAMKYLGERENKLVGVADDIFEKVRGELESGLEAGETMKELADRVRSTTNQINEGRAWVVARTETTVVYGVGRQEAMRSEGIQYKQWLSSRNQVVRPTHQAADKLPPTPIDEPFIVGGFPMMHPGDPSGPAKEVINCYCVQIAVAAPKGEEE